MSYAGSTSRDRLASRDAAEHARYEENYADAAARDNGTHLTSDQLAAADAAEARAWRTGAAFTVGILVGALVGASTALLASPYSGDEARGAINRRARRARRRMGWALEDFGDDLGYRARGARRKMNGAVRAFRDR